jgi:hypothetical protein
MDELQRHRDAFEAYFKYKQEGHTIEEAIMLLTGDFKVTRKTLYKWKKTFDWDGREAIRATEINRRVQESTDNSIIENKTHYLSFYHKLLGDLKKDFGIKIKTPRDLDLVIKGALLLQGEPTEHTQTTGKHEVDVSIHDRINQAREYFDQLDESREGSGDGDNNQ